LPVSKFDIGFTFGLAADSGPGGKRLADDPLDLIQPSGRGLIAIPERDATLRLRIPADHYRDVLPLAGKQLDIDGHQIRLGLPVARPLDPAPSLYARVVTIKFTEAESFIGAVKRRLDSFGTKVRAIDGRTSAN